jgi:NAD(P)-dependent dehydrogenase (short-subunit alcohol dehydrogenase family)
MKKSRWGRIVNIGSSSSYGGSANTAVYCMTKHGLLGFTRALSEELKSYNIRVYCISPSGTKTKMGKDIIGQDYDSFLNPREIAEFISFVISFDGEMITDEVRLNRLFTG